MAVSIIPVGNQFTRLYPVALDQSFVFNTTAEREAYASSPVAYSGLVAADLQTNKVYILGSGMTWQQVGVTVNETFGASNSGMLFKTGDNTFAVRGLSSGNNISITNPSGLDGNPTIGLSSSITGLNSISGVDNFTIASNSGINLNAGDGAVTIDDLTVSGATNLNGNINIGLAARILATGPIAFSGNPVAFVGQTLFDTLPKVGPTGNNGVNATGVSLSGHKHVYTDVTNFCDGVASCVDTAMSPSTGIQFSYGAGTLSIALSGQSLKLHNLNSDGLIVRDNGNIVSRTIVASGSNILVGSGNGVGGNPNIGLNPDVSVTTLSTSSGATIGADLTVEGNLIVNGDTVTTNVSTIRVEDPTIRLGATTGVLSGSDTKDRGVEFVYRRSGTVPITGFFGYDHSEDAFVFLKNSTNSSETYTGTSALVNVGGLYSAGEISGTILTSTVSSPNAPIVVASTGLVSNLNADYLDGQDGSYYRDGVNITGTISSGILPNISSTFTLAASNPTSGYNFVNDLTVDRAGRLLNAKSGIIPTATSVDLGLAKFNTDNFSVTNGDVTIKDGGVILGTETTGQYAKTVSVAGTGLTATTANAANDTSYTITSNATSVNTTGTIVARNTSDGGFTAGTITATGFIGNGSSITGIDAVNITGVANLASGVLPTVTLSSPFPAVDNSSSLANFINSVTVDRAGRVTAATSGVHRDATTTVKGIASFSSGNFDVSTGAVSVKTGGISNSNLANSSMTFGSTSVSLGGSTSSLSGLTSISGTSEASPTTLAYCVIDGGSP